MLKLFNKFARSTPSQIEGIAQQVMINKLARKQERYNKTDEGRRVDIGILIDRAPIYYTLDPIQMRHYKFINDMNAKFKNQIDISNKKEMTDYSEPEALREYYKASVDNTPSHIKPLDNKQKVYYYENTKEFSKIIPNEKDNKKLMYEPTLRVYLLVKNKYKWFFPYRPVKEKETLAKAVDDLQVKAFQGSISSIGQGMLPVMAQQSEFTEDEQKDKNNKDLNGKTIYIYQQSHLQGKVEVDSQFEDFAWVPKYKMNQYLNETDYRHFIHFFQHY